MAIERLWGQERGWFARQPPEVKAELIADYELLAEEAKKG